MTPTNSKTKDAKTMKLCTVIVCHIPTKINNKIFIIFIVPLFIAIVLWCLIVKSGSKMVKISNASYENEIHRIDSAFNEDSKKYNFFGQGSPNLVEGQPEYSGKMAKTMETYCYAN